MDPKLLSEQLAQLHEELAKTQHVDAGATPQLAELMQDIKRLMTHPAAAQNPAPDVNPRTALGTEVSLPDRLERIAVQFEADHPTLAASSRRLIDLLGKAGL